MHPNTGGLRIPHRTLLGPGPSNVHPQVLQAMGSSILGHLDPDFFPIMDDVQRMLRQVFKIRNGITFPISGTGTAGMEAVLTNLLGPGDQLLATTNGFFSNRTAEVASRCGAEVHPLEFPWGTPVDPETVRTELRQRKGITAVTVTHVETSTGVLSPIHELAQVTHEYDALLIVDAVASLGGCEVDVSGWDLDAVFSATQKCLSAPSGMAPIAMGPRAVEKMQARKNGLSTLYLDIPMLAKYWSEEERHAYHHTVPMSLVYSLWQALTFVLEEGLEERYHRHLRHTKALRVGLEAIGLELLVPENYWAPTLTAVLIPDGISDSNVRQKLIREYSIEIGGGLGEFQGKAWRIGLMGYSSTAANIYTVLSALERILRDEGLKLKPGAGVAAAQTSLLEN